VVTKRCVLEREVHTPVHDAALVVDRGWHPESESSDGIVHQGCDRRLKLGDDVFLRVLRSRALVAADDLSITADDAGEDLRAAKVDADGVEVFHRGYRNCTGGHAKGEAQLAFAPVILLVFREPT
jgi:hypothetical protein